jgi:hypothetical protein
MEAQFACNWELSHEFLKHQAENSAAHARLTAHWEFSARGTNECPAEFLVVDRNAFSLDLPDTISILYQHAPRGELEPHELEEIEDAAEKHVNLVAHRLLMAMVSMDEAPYIRYVASDRGKAERVAVALAEQLDAYRDLHANWRPNGLSDKREGKGRRARALGEPGEPATLLVIDRIDDLAPVLLHGGLSGSEYAALLEDLCEYVPGLPLVLRATKAAADRPEMMLDDEDPVWRLLCRENLSEVAAIIKEARKAYHGKMEAAAALRQEGGAAAVAVIREGMMDVINDMALLNDKIKQHVRLFNMAMNAQDARDVTVLAKLELELATGVSERGELVHDKQKALEARARELLKTAPMSGEDRARVVALLLLTLRALEPKTVDELVDDCAPEFAAALRNLPDVCVPLARTKKMERPEAAPYLDDETTQANKKAWGACIAGVAQRAARLRARARARRRAPPFPSHPPPPFPYPPPQTRREKRKGGRTCSSPTLARPRR